MENNSYEPTDHAKETSMYPPSNPNYPESSSSGPPPYSNPNQYPPNPGVPYPPQYTPQPMGYPAQPYGPPPGGQPYYPNQAFQPQYPQQQQQQQQQIIYGGIQPSVGYSPVFVVGQPTVSMVGATVLSCITYWCCCFLLGGIGFILAMVGQSSATAGDTLGALRLRNASYGLSIAGIVIGIIIITIVAGVLGSARMYSSPTYYYNCPYSNSYYCK